MAETPSIVRGSPQRFMWKIGAQALIVLLLLIGTVAIDLRQNQLQERQGRITTYRTTVTDTATAIVDMQNAVRGYILSGDPASLEPYAQAVPQIEQLFTTLNITPFFPAELRTWQENVERWRREYAEREIALIQSNEVAQAQTLSNSETAKGLFTQIRQQATNLRGLLLTESQRIDNQISLLDKIQLVIALFLATLVAIGIVMIGNFAQREKQLWHNLTTTSAELLITNQTLQEQSSKQQRINQRLKARINESRLLSDINDMVVRGRPANEIYPLIAEQVGMLLHGWCSIMLRQQPPNDDLLEVAALYYPEAQKLESMRHLLDQQPFNIANGLHAPVFTTKKPVVVIDIPPEIRQPANLNAEQQAMAEIFNLTSYIAVPIFLDDQVVGLLSVASSTSGHLFEPEQEMFLSQIADRLSVWLDNMRLFALTEQQATELQAMFNSITDIVATFDAQGRRTRINQAGRDFLGNDKHRRGPAQLLLRHPNGHALLPDEHPVQQALKGATLQDIELAISRFDEKGIVHTISVAPMRNLEGGIEGVVLVARDISARKDLDRLKEEFLANMSHELRTPLTAILGYSELLLKNRREFLQQWHLNKIEGIRTGGFRLLALVNDLLDIAKLEAGQVELHRKLSSIDTLIATQVNLQRAAIEHKQQQVALELAANIPELSLDPERVTQVLSNLLSNASKFTPTEGMITIASGVFESTLDMVQRWQSPPLALDLPTHPPGTYVVISVRDTGVGILPEQLPYLWDRFYQADGGSNRSFGGTGLGLSIVRQLVELHGGLTWAESRGQNQGSTFAFTLPIEAAISAGRFVHPQHDLSILMIEDDLVTARLFENHLQAAGFNVMHARSVNEALVFAEQLRPAVITLDLQLPDGNGWDLLVELRKLHHLKDTPVVVISVAETPPLHLGLGIEKYLVKPITGEVLIQIIKQLIPIPLRTTAPVLVIDDDPELVGLLRDTLQEHGVATHAASDGAEAWELLRNGPLPSLILLDLMIPLVDGFQLLARMRDEPRTQNIPVIIITARDLNQEEYNQLQFAAQGIRFKHGLDFKKLVTEIQRYVVAQEGAADA